MTLLSDLDLLFIICATSLMAGAIGIALDRFFSNRKKRPLR